MSNRVPISGTIAYRGGVPVVYESFLESYAGMIDYNYRVRREDIRYMATHKTYRHEAAMELADQFSGDWLLMLDTDHVFEPSACLDLITIFEAMNLDLLSGFYQYRAYPYLPVAYRWDKKAMQFNILNPVPAKSETNLVQIDATGFGCLIVRRKVLEAVREVFNVNPFDHYRMPGLGRRQGPLLDEALSFFYLLKDIEKFSLWLAPWIEFRHIAQVPVTRGLMSASLKGRENAL